MLSQLERKVAVVSGGSHGIGRATALTLAKSGADLVIADRDQEPAMKIVSEIEAMGRRALFELCDLWDFDSVKEMIDRAIAKMGKIDITVASGGATVKYAKFFRDIDPSEYSGCLQTQQWSRLYLIRSVLDHMIERGYGKIVIITTDAGRVATPRESLIGSAAAGLALMTKALAREFSRWNIRVNAICLTVVQDTPAYEAVMATEARHVFEKASGRAPFGLPTPQDVAEAVLYMASPESDRITGQILSINGGLSFPG
jgi:3-oxoacyl-[acyl-carrier protein] reductase